MPNYSLPAYLPQLPSFAGLVPPNCSPLQAWVLSQLPFSAGPVTLNFPPLPAWSPLTALPCRVDHLQLPSLAGLIPPNCPLLLAILCRPSCVHMGAAIFDHMGAAILCIGVIVNLHITLLLDRMIKS
uniref:Uncharacterized protein n=1 Tax=Pipistrellus kuhlii TaxID=59472 RepID=A0A7J7W3I1_PIPKU|nr:hypothetical protein mPipKuh1_008150 [Pipistrellus kuhlii]